MKRTVRMVKGMGACELMTAQDISIDTGYTWKDVLHAASHGRMIWYPRRTKQPNHHHKLHDVPFLFRQETNRKWEGKPRVITPTCRLKRSTSEALTIDTFKILTPNGKDWDNNAFWNPTANQDRMTFHSQGLYLVNAVVEYTQHAAYDIHLSFEKNGAGFFEPMVGLGGPTYPPNFQITMLDYMNQDDYVRVNTVVHSTGISAQLLRFWCVAITPEAIY